MAARRHPRKGRRGALTGPQHSTTRRHRDGQQETPGPPGQGADAHDRQGTFEEGGAHRSGTADNRMVKAGGTDRRPKSGGLVTR